jgi:hypothetical protein
MTWISHAEQLGRQTLHRRPRSAARTGTRLNGILVKIAAGLKLSPFSQDFLITHGFHSLHSMANGLIDWEEFEQLIPSLYGISSEGKN